MRLEITAHMRSGPVAHSCEVNSAGEAERVIRRTLRSGAGRWTADHETSLRTIMRSINRSGAYTSRSLVVRLYSDR